MKRRDFIRRSAVAGGSAALAPALGGCVQEQRPAEATYLKGGRPEVSLLQELDNEYLHVDLFSDASLEIHDKAGGFTWKSGPVALQELGEIEQGHVWLRQDRSMCEQYPGRFAGRREGESIRFTLLGRQDRVWGTFRATFGLSGEWLTLQTDQIDDTIPSLVFPPPIESDRLVIPRGIGQLLSGMASRTIYTRTLNTFFTHLNMRFIGGQTEGHAWIGIYEDGFEDACCLIANGSVSPGYMRSLAKWRHGYRMKYRFMKGDYVEVAKAYREDFMERGLFRPLAEKVKENPALDKFRGGRGFWISLAFPGYRQEFIEDFLLKGEQAVRRGSDRVNVRLTYRQLKQFIDRLQHHGLEKGFLKVAGWINRGYDASHPDVWPPEPSLGAVEELREILGMEASFALGLHDNYQDIYETSESFPDGVCRWKDGSLQTGGAWAGGQAYILHGTASLAYAKRNWEKIGTLAPAGMMVDTTTAMQLYQSFEKGRERTKGDDLKAKADMIKFFKEQGTLFGSEEVADFAIPHIDWYETRHHRVQGETIPLWPLVFHDAALLMSYGSGSPPAVPPVATPLEWLEAMQWGYMLHFFHRDDFDFGRFGESFHVDRWHERVALAEMTDHRFMDDAMSVERTEFSSGQAIICNYGPDPVDVEGVVVEGISFRILT
jgi:hypothetical protein